MGLIFKKTLFRGEAPMFIMELPPYRMPSFTSLCLHTWEKGKHFLFKAGTYIFAVSILVWFMLNLPWGVEHKRDSYLGQAGAAIAPIFQPVGFGTWEAASSLITGVIAKEIVVGTMGEIYTPKHEEKKETPTLGEDLKEIVVSFGTAAKTAVTTLLYIPGEAEKEEDQSALNQAIKAGFTPLYLLCLHGLCAALHALHDRRGRHAPGVRHLEMGRRRFSLPDRTGLGGGADHLPGGKTPGTGRVTWGSSILF